jgi:integrase
MPIIRLNDRKLASLKPTGRQVDYFDDALSGFGVRVSQTGRKTFMVLYRTTDRRLRRQTLGVYPDLSLAKARDEAQAALRKATLGRDPATEQQQSKTQTFGALGDLYLEQHAKRHKRSWRHDARMIRQEFDVWTDRPVVSIRRAEIRDLLEGIVSRGAPVLANRVLSLVRKVLNFAVDREWLDANPAAKLARPSAEASRTRVLTEAEIRTVWTHLGQPAPDDRSALDQRHWTLTRAALKLRLLTAQRGGEVLAMRGSDLDGSWWTIPVDVSKNKLPHRVWLSTAALTVLDTLTGDDRTGYVFAGIRGPRHRRGALDGLTVENLRPHDFRRTAASLMAAGGVPRLTVSKILNHVDRTVTAIYDRHSYDAEKQQALDWWALTLDAIVSGTRSKVLPFVRGR